MAVSFQRYDASLFGTDQHGTTTFVTDGTDYEVMAERGVPRAPLPRPDRRTRTTNNDCIDINTASREELQQIVHIDPSRARQIIKLHQQRRFDDVSSLTRVRGIGPARLDDIDVVGEACG